MSTPLMPVWPGSMMQTPSRTDWSGEPMDSRVRFDPETGPPLMRPRVTAEAWTFSGTFPMADDAERRAMLDFWDEIGRGAKRFLWRDPENGQVRQWQFAGGEDLRLSLAGDSRWDIGVSLIRLPSTPWWAALIPDDRLVAPVAAYDFRRGLYHNGSEQVGFDAAVSFSRAVPAPYYDADGILQTAGSDVPRFDHDPQTGAPRGLLIENDDNAALIASHGPCDLRVTFDDDSAQTLSGQNMTLGWWPAMDRPHIASIAVFQPGVMS